MVDDETKARALRSVDVYCAPNTGGESFGIVLTEAMSAGAAVLASDLDAFRRVLDDGKAGVLTPVGDPSALADALRDLLTDPNDAAIVETIIGLSRNLGLEVIAEGVETPEQRELLARAGCQLYQGYLFSRPLSADRLEAFLRPVAP